MARSVIPGTLARGVAAAAGSRRLASLIKALEEIVEVVAKIDLTKPLPAELPPADLLVVAWNGAPDRAKELVAGHRDDYSVLSLTQERPRPLDEARAAGSDAIGSELDHLPHLTHIAVAKATSRLRGRVSRLEARLREQDYQHNVLTRLLLHDLKNPLTVTLGSLQVARLAGGEALPPKVRRLLDAAEEGCAAQLAIIQNLSDLIRLESADFRLISRVFDPLPPVRRQVIAYQKLDPSKNYSFAEDAQCPPLWGDPEAFERIVRNLLDNAMRHTRTGGIIEIALDADTASNKGRLTLTDNGEAIPAGLLDAIFDRRSLALGQHSGARLDSGMGLAYSRAAARAMDGDLIALDAGGRGARFELILPTTSGTTGGSAPKP